MNQRARAALAVAIGLAGLALLLVAAAGTARWVTAVPLNPDLPGTSRVPLKGSTLVPAAVPLALVGVAGVIAAAVAGRVARGVLRLTAAVLVVAAGVGIVALTAGALTHPGHAVRSAERARQANATAAADTSGIGWFATAGGVALVAAGGVAIRYRRSWPGLAARYDRAGETGETGETGERDDAGDVAGTGRARPPAASTWDALERGEDPTREP
jgi:uncharacterized membrane protein (TIGR02234 family)